MIGLVYVIWYSYGYYLSNSRLGPRANFTMGETYSSDKKYKILVRYEDFGGTYAECDDLFSNGCGGIHMKVYIKKNKLIDLSREISLSDALEKKIPCSTWEAECSSPLEQFEVKDNTIYWYGETISELKP